MNNIQLSIIIPVYNVEKYIRKCIDSVLNQDLSNYEIIIINDGTKDNCQLIIDEYVRNYPHLIKSFIKNNGGLSSARNYGIERAKGKYICFLDSDDYVEKNHYAKMLDLAIKNNSDLVVSDFEYIWENKNKTLYKSGLRKLCDTNNRNIFLSPLFSWNKMYKKELFDKLHCRYPEGLWYEDIPVTLKFAINSNRIDHLSSLGFHYLQRNSSIMGTAYSKKMEDIFIILEKAYNELVDCNMLEKYRDEIEYLFVEHLLVYGAFRFLRTDHYKELMKKSFSLVNEYFPNYKKNKYIGSLGFKNNFFLQTNNLSTCRLWHIFLVWRDK